MALNRDNVSNFEIGLKAFVEKLTTVGNWVLRVLVLYLQVLFNALLKPWGWFLILGLDW